MSIRMSIPVLLALLVGCGSTTQRFEPTENVAGRTMEGYEEASYELSAAGDTYGEVKVFSSGAYRVDTDRGQATMLQVGFTVENVGQEPIELGPDDVMLESVQASGGVQRDLRPSAVSGDTRVEPGTVGTATFDFVLPDGLSPDDIHAFRVRWMTRTNGRYFTEFTPFVQKAPRTAYVLVDGYYHPYYSWTYPYYSPWYRTYRPRRVIVVNPYPRRVIVRGHRRPARRR